MDTYSHQNITLIIIIVISLLFNISSFLVDSDNLKINPKFFFNQEKENEIFNSIFKDVTIGPDEIDSDKEIEIIIRFLDNIDAINYIPDGCNISLYLNEKLIVKIKDIVKVKVINFEEYFYITKFIFPHLEKGKYKLIVETKVIMEFSYNYLTYGLDFEIY